MSASSSEAPVATTKGERQKWARSTQEPRRRRGCGRPGQRSSSGVSSAVKSKNWAATARAISTSVAAEVADGHDLAQLGSFLLRGGRRRQDRVDALERLARPLGAGDLDRGGRRGGHRRLLGVADAEQLDEEEGGGGRGDEGGGEAEAAGRGRHRSSPGRWNAPDARTIWTAAWCAQLFDPLHRYWNLSYSR